MEPKEYKSRHLLLDSEVFSILEKYKSGISSPKLAAEFNLSKNEMLRLLGSHNVTRSNLEAKNLRAASVNHLFFDVIDTPEKAWCLGLMYSDGNVSPDKPIISCTMCDEDVIEKMKLLMSYEGSIILVSKSKRVKNPSQPYTIYISSSQLKNDLIRHGCTPAKSLILKMPTTVSNPVEHHFIRGYFDGDGCISTGIKNTASFTCPEEMANSIKAVLLRNGVKCSMYRDKRAKNSCDVRIVEAQLPNLFNYMYKDSIPNTRMDRKYQKFTNYLKGKSKTCTFES